MNDKEYYQNNKQKWKGYGKAQLDEGYFKKYYQEHKTQWQFYVLKIDRKKQKNLNRKWKLNNKSKIQVENKIYREANPEKILFYKIKSLKKYGKVFNRNEHQFLYALKTWSRLVRNQFNNLCQICGGKAEHSHHLIYLSAEPKLALNPNNGIAL